MLDRDKMHNFHSYLRLTQCSYTEISNFSETGNLPDDFTFLIHNFYQVGILHFPGTLKKNCKTDGTKWCRSNSLVRTTNIWKLPNMDFRKNSLKATIFCIISSFHGGFQYLTWQCDPQWNPIVHTLCNQCFPLWNPVFHVLCNQSFLFHILCNEHFLLQNPLSHCVLVVSIFCCHFTSVCVIQCSAVPDGFG